MTAASDPRSGRPARLLALDVGNTSVAAALHDRPIGSVPPAWREHRVRGADEAAELAFWSARVRERAADADPGAILVVVGSVHRFGLLLAERLRSEGWPVTGLHRGDAVPIATDVRAPDRVGVDRLAAALAATTLAKGAALVVDCGTAITVDWVDAGGRFRGGAIVPGRTLMARALHSGTDQLPELAPWGNPPPLHLPGRDTEEAIRHGLDVGIPALVDGLVADLQRAAGAALPVYATGGDAPWLLARTRAAARHDPDLVTRGLALAQVRLEEGRL